MERTNPWATLASAAGLTGAAVAFVYAVGGLVLSLRYEAFGLNGQEAAALTSREVLLFSGATSLARWTLVGLVLVVALWLLRLAGRWLLRHRRPASMASRLPRPRRMLVAATVAVAVALFPLAHVWWLLAAVVALAAVAWEATETASPGSESDSAATGRARAAEAERARTWRLRRWLVIAAGIGLVAVTYEADRLRYRLNWACVDVADERAHRCGILLGQNDRGLYIGASSSARSPAARGAPYRLVFVPAERVMDASSTRRTARIIESSADARREPPLTRVLSIDIR